MGDCRGVGCALGIVLALGAAKAGELLLDELVHHLHADTDREREQALAQLAGEIVDGELDLLGQLELARLIVACDPQAVVVVHVVLLWIGLCPSRSTSERGRRTASKFHRVRDYVVIKQRWER